MIKTPRKVDLSGRKPLHVGAETVSLYAGSFMQD